MSEKSLVVQQGSLSDMGAAMSTAHDDLVEQIEDTITKVKAETVGWNPATASAIAHAEHQRKLEAGVERLAAALGRVRTALAEIATDAHDTEVDNRAIVD